jgi:hypothetical protein
MSNNFIHHHNLLVLAWTCQQAIKPVGAEGPLYSDWSAALGLPATATSH